MKPRLTQTIDGYRVLRDACSEATRNLGFVTESQWLAPEHWQRVLTAVEVRAQMLRIDLPEGWREELAVQMGRDEAEAHNGQES